MQIQNFFTQPTNIQQKQYEALRSAFVDNLSYEAISEKYGFSISYFKKLKYLFSQQIKRGENPFFQSKKPGPKKRSTEKSVIQNIVELRKKNHSISDIRMILQATEIQLSLQTIDDILKERGFAPLPRRTRKEKAMIFVPEKIVSPPSQPREEKDEILFTEQNAGALIFLPLIEKLGIITAIQDADFPYTNVLNNISSVLSFIGLKIIGSERFAHDEIWGLDRALGLFAGLNVLPKNSTLSSYSYRVTRSMNRAFLLSLNRIFQDSETETGDFNLDFKTIPHWGDASVLEKNWAGTRSKAMKSVLALIAEDPATRLLSYTNAEIKHADQNEAIFQFVDFWKEGRGTPPKMLIFDSKFTTYQNLSKLNQSPEQIKFLTLRRRGKNLIDKAKAIPDSEWKTIKVDGKNRKHKLVRVYEEICRIRNYKGELRQLIIKDHGRINPTFMITNDCHAPIRTLVQKYARRWLVEQEIAEQIVFFHLNQLSSSIVVKVDFDLTLTLLTHNLYRRLSQHLPGFEACTVATIYRKFIENGARVQIENDTITVWLKKKNHLPILFEVPWMKEKSYISWLNMDIQFKMDTTS